MESQSNLKALTEGIHSKEALTLVREHVLGVMGSAGMAYSNTMLKMSKLQVWPTVDLIGCTDAGSRRCLIICCSCACYYVVSSCCIAGGGTRMS